MLAVKVTVVEKVRTDDGFKDVERDAFLSDFELVEGQIQMALHIDECLIVDYEDELLSRYGWEEMEVRDRMDELVCKEENFGGYITPADSPLGQEILDLLPF